jgi:carboxylesterase
VTGSAGRLAMGVMPGAGTFFFEGSDVGCLLIHGFTGTPQNIRPLGDFLARRGFTVLAPRLAGHGTTIEDFEQSGAEDWIGTINTGLDQLRHTCSTVFAIGISMGGTLALHLGATRGTDLAGVGCINGPVMDLPAFEAAADDPATPARMAAPWTNPRLLAKDLNAAGITYLEIPKVTLKKALGVFKQVQGELAQVRIPTLLFFSRDDAVVDPANGPFILERLGASDKRLVELEDSAHEATLDFDLERIGLEWVTFIRQHSRVLTSA